MVPLDGANSVRPPRKLVVLTEDIIIICARDRICVQERKWKTSPAQTNQI